MSTTSISELNVPARELRGRRKTLGLAAGLLLLAAVVAYGAYWWTVGRHLQSTDDAYVGGDITVMSAKVPGYIAQVPADNQAVRAGDLLVKLDDRDYVAALQRAEGDVAAQRALLDNLTATRKLQDSLIQHAQAEVTAAQAERQRAQEDAVRYRRLSGSSAVSLQSWQQADAVHKRAVAAEQQAQADLQAARQRVDVIQAQIEQANAALMQAQAAYRIAQLNLAYTEVRAPVDGTVGNRRAKLGAYAQAGTQLLALVPERGLWVDANFKESQLAGMKPGQPARIEADVLPGKVFHGRVASIAPATGAQFSVLPAENATGNFTKIVQRVPVRIMLDDEDARLGLLRPGLSVVVEVDERGAP